MKPRSDSKLLNLPEEKIAQISDWLLSGMPYHQVKNMLKDQFQVSTSLASLSDFYQSVCAQELIARRKRAVTTADEIAQEAQTKPGQFDAATIDALKQKAFELSISPGADPGDVKSLFMLVLKARDQELSEKQLKLDHDKFEVEVCEKILVAVNDARIREIADSAAGNSEKIAAIRKVYFADVDAMEKSGEVQLPQ